jgi:hypothetical protein
MAHFRGVDLKFGENAAESIAMHSEFFGSFALITAVGSKHFKDKAPLEFTHGFIVGDATSVHLGDQAVQFSFHSKLSFFLPVVRRGNWSCVLQGKPEPKQRASANSAAPF